MVGTNRSSHPKFLERKLKFIKEMSFFDTKEKKRANFPERRQKKAKTEISPIPRHLVQIHRHSHLLLIANFVIASATIFNSLKICLIDHPGF